MENEVRQSSLSSLIGALFILVAAVVYVFFVKVVADENALKEADLAALEAEIDLLRGGEEIAGLGEIANLSALEIKEAARKIPDALTQDEVLRSLIEMAEDNEITLNSIGFSKGATTLDGVGSLRINAGFQGNYQDLVNFLEAIEQSRRFYRVTSINVTVNRLNVTDLEVANFSLSLETFYLL